MLHRIHNPHDYECGCDPDCWCRRTTIGRAVKWRFPARRFGIRHKNSFFGGMSIVRLGPSRWGLTVRMDDDSMTVHEIVGGARLDTAP